MASLSDITLQIKKKEEEIAQMRKQAEELRVAELAGVIQEVRSKIAEYEITAAELKLAAPKARKGARVATTPKYRGPNDETWSGGRGRKPRWITDALAAGKSLLDFEV